MFVLYDYYDDYWFKRQLKSQQCRRSKTDKFWVFLLIKISVGISYKSNESLFHSTATACENERFPKLERNFGTSKLSNYFDLVTIVFRIISSD